ncbi:restriction endonuclease subunit S [Erwinia piriflorinigrans]|uniref:Type I restriction enzyme, S subunit n=1 Tax=Erwinia piriflorinigrans CFBP 5888 TaxID=1161919 RepID=V5Z426_9GAMM|nr:restriction endonuclease subunit S [Erwinia piriflorinigrans]CCG85764.1 type I restriction enzyme, S subunit [Erwinia piriflorinigrans CFBP 5888]
MSMEKKEPEIRFKGFTGEWEEREFSGIASRVSTHHQSTCLPCVEYEDIVAGKGRFNKDIHQKKTFKAGLKFEADDVLFGKLRPYLKNWFLADFEGLAVGDFWVLRADNVASTFLFYLIQTNEFELISNLSAGSKMPRSDWGLVSSSCFFVPNNISESNEIGDYFQKLDTLINQHQQKHDKLSSIKKSMLEKMFPKPGETIPEIRFNGFSGEWEEKAICQLFTVTRGNVLSTTKTNPSPTPDKRYPVYSSQTKNNGLMGFYDKYLFENAITWTTDGANAGTVNFRDGKFYSTNVNGVLLSDEGYANKAIAEILNKEAWRHVSHVGNPKLMNNVMSAIKITIPNSFEEQTQIGNYFQKLDNLINQHQQQITKLNNIKQACLSKMFV